MLLTVRVLYQQNAHTQKQAASLKFTSFFTDSPSAIERLDLSLFRPFGLQFLLFSLYMFFCAPSSSSDSLYVIGKQNIRIRTETLNVYVLWNACSARARLLISMNRIKYIAQVLSSIYTHNYRCIRQPWKITNFSNATFVTILCYFVWSAETKRLLEL